MKNPGSALPAILDTAYRLDLPEWQWQERLADSIWNLYEELPGILVYEVKCSGTRAEAHTRLFRGAIDRYAEAAESVHKAMDSREYQGILTPGSHSSTVRRRLERESFTWEDMRGVPDGGKRLGYRDLWAVCSVVSEGEGLVFSSPIYDDREFSETELSEGSRIARHIAAACRARRSVSDSIEESSAILAPDGRFCYRTEGSLESGLEHALSRAVVTTARARADRSGEHREAEALWDLLLSQGWSLLHHTDTDGKRFILAVRDTERRVALSPRERAVIDMASEGFSNKVIASDLGIALSTVATHLANGLAKLRVSSRRELIALRRSTAGFPKP